MSVLEIESRLGVDPRVDKIEVKNLDGFEGLFAIEEWLDDQGI